MPKSIISSAFRFIALTPPGQADPSIAIAASRAGDLGVLDLEYVSDKQRAQAAVARLVQFAKGSCGLKFESSTAQATEQLIADLPAPVEVVVLTPAAPQVLRPLVQLVQRQKRHVWLEATTLEEAELGNEVRVNGLIAKGHEAGGRVGEETTFVLLQRLLAYTDLPIWAQGGIGLHTAAACYAAGAAGVVLDAQLYLARESSLPDRVKTAIGRMDGSETTCLGSRAGGFVRLYARPGLPPVKALADFSRQAATHHETNADRQTSWRQALGKSVGWGSPEEQVWLVGQDAAFAAALAARFGTVADILDGMRSAVADHIHRARQQLALNEHSPLARIHGTRYPIVQGPMTRVSDTAAFALKVAEGGGLPFLALALMRAPQVEAVLAEARELLGDRPWGVGILGFVPLELRQEQLEVIRAYRPDFALIAGGRPDQALALEQIGIATYLHVPSPGLLELFIKGGARRFVFEGRECGGHVGPRTSFVLWNTMIDMLLALLPASDMADCHVLFAGGIHDATSAAMVAAMAAPLVDRGVKIGVLLGTAYLFTEEAVATGAITPGFQHQAMQCAGTVLLETGPGHATRCVETPYVRTFEEEKRRLSAAGVSAEELREALEKLNIGRLRVASKGIDRYPKYGQEPEAPKFISLNEEEQHTQGMYMIGQLAALRDKICSIEALHREIAVESTKRLANLSEPIHVAIGRKERPFDVAIVGMACLLPKASDLQTYWENIFNRVNAITEVPADRWDWRTYFDADPKARDKVYSKWGGFLDDVPFDPMRYGMPPSSLPSIDPLQLLTLEVVRAALEDAGYDRRPFSRERTSVVLGVSGGAGDLGQQYALRAGLSGLFENPPPDVWTRLPEWTEDSFAGILLNVAAGRVANRFDFGGVNYTVDAACASSLAAISLAARELEHGSSDMVIAGGVDTVQNPFGYLCFSKTQALSSTGESRTFDESADGIAISEGLAVLVLKRLADAERAGDRIYAVIKGVAGSSDGKDKGLTAPRQEGQILALERAYAKAGFSPATVGLIEAHGTGTVVGDQTEVQALKQVFDAANAVRQSCAIGSVKSMIGHTKATAGVAGLIKVALALHHKILPPTLHVEKPNPKARFPESPFYVNTETRPWIHGTSEQPRRAGVSAFGFGGTNFHAVVEEYTDTFVDTAYDAPSVHWPGELLLWRGDSRRVLLADLDRLAQALTDGATPALADLAYTLWRQAEDRTGLTLAIVTTSLEDLQQKLAWVRDALQGSGGAVIHDPRGIYFTEKPLAHDGQVAFLFPGQGSQYPDMLRHLVLHFPEVRTAFEQADRVLANQLPKRLSAYVFPPPSFVPEGEQADRQALTQTHIAQPALGAASIGLFHLLKALGIRPAFVAGHSYGEYVALYSAGVFSEDMLYKLSEARGRCIMEATGQEDLGTMAAVTADLARVQDLVKSMEGVWIANINAPNQTGISGTREGIAQAIGRLESEGIGARTIPVACAFHSPIIAPARDRLAEVLSTVAFSTPDIEVFSNTTAAPYPDDPQAIAALLAEHLVSPVRFADEVKAMYQAGARLFVEVGPRNVLTGLTARILDDQPHLAVAIDAPDRAGLLQLQHALGQLAAHGVSLQLDRLYKGRRVRQLNLNALEEESRPKPLPPTTWLVNGGRARPLHKTNLLRASTTATSHTQAGSNGLTPSAAPASEERSQPSGHVATDKTRVTSPAPLKATGRAREETSPNQPVSPQQLVPSMSNGDIHGVMHRFQQSMNNFLETQQQVMLAYLNTSGAGVQTPPEDAQAASAEEVKPTIAPTAPPHAEMPATVQLQPTSHGAAGPATNAEPQSLSDKEQITQKLVEIVSTRTGYPPQMLNLDLDIEADLGIDSIKRVEILGAFQQTYLISSHLRVSEAMEQLTAIKTLRGIVDMISTTLNEQVTGASEASTDLAHASTENSWSAPDSPDSVVTVPRFLLRAVERPLADESLPLRTDGIFVITDDERGIARSIAATLRKRGTRVVLVQMAPEYGESDGGDTYRVDLTDPDSVEVALKRVHEQHGLITGLIHLLPLKAGASFNEMDLAGWQARLALDMKSLYYLTRAVGTDLKQTEGQLIAATSMGGAFASIGAEPLSFWPSQGGICGFVKTLALEWPQVRHRVVDLDLLAAPAELVEQLVAEITARDDEVEVGYYQGQRVVLQPIPAPLDEGGPSHLALDSHSVVLVTGGARGISAEVALGLAEHYQSILLLVGRSPLPDLEEAPQTAGLDTQRELKAALMDQMQRSGEAVTLTKVEAAYTSLMRAREMRRNLARMKQTGATVHYYQTDVRDAEAFGRLIENIYTSFGRIDGIIHGAGVIEDKLIEDKRPDSFDRVFDTKALSVFILSRVIQPDKLKFLVFFSSVAGRFGNRGQSDYAAASEVLNKLAVFLNRNWPGRIVSVNWGPWMSAGMVSPDVQRQFEERGVGLIPPSVGQRLLETELRYGQKSNVEVILGEGPWATTEVSQSSSAAFFPLLNGVSLSAGGSGSVEATYRFDLSEHLYLQDHRLDGKPVLPAAMAMELMGEFVQKGWPKWKVVGVQTLRVLKGIIFDGRIKSVRMVAQPQTRRSHEHSELEVDVKIADSEHWDHVYYQATILLAERLPDPPPFKPPFHSSMREFPITVDEAYRQWLFHGSRFQCISELEGIGDQGIVATIVPSTPQQCVASAKGDQWCIDPVVVDSGPQLAILWSRAYKNMTALPSSFQRYRRYGSLSGPMLRCYFQVLPGSEDHTLGANVFFVDEAGRLLGLLEGLESPCSMALNRLTSANSDQARGGL